MTYKFIVIVIVKLLICYQIIVFTNYFYVYIVEYLNGKKSTFNKFKDRWIFVLSLFLILYCCCFLLEVLTIALNENSIFRSLLSVLNSIVITLLLHLGLNGEKSIFTVLNSIVITLLLYLGLKREKNIPCKLKKKENNILIKSEFHLESINIEDQAKINEQFHEHFENFDDSIYHLYQQQIITIPLNCISIEKNKSVGYKKIFELLDGVTRDGILDLFDEEREKLYKFIISNFKRDGKSIDLDNLKCAYCKWRAKNA